MLNENSIELAFANQLVGQKYLYQYGQILPDTIAIHTENVFKSFYETKYKIVDVIENGPNDLPF
ncbi:MAG: hypothetical protein PHW92_02115 [Lutibacter sp.]|nr:hypothetical protein [Lutibacter sp.]